MTKLFRSFPVLTSRAVMAHGVLMTGVLVSVASLFPSVASAAKGTSGAAATSSSASASTSGAASSEDDQELDRLKQEVESTPAVETSSSPANPTPGLSTQPAPQQAPTQGYPSSTSTVNPTGMLPYPDDASKGSGAHASYNRFTWSLRGSVPLGASASAGILIPLSIEAGDPTYGGHGGHGVSVEKEEGSLDISPAILVQLEGGIGGGKFSLGWAGVSSDYTGRPFSRAFGVDVKASLLRTFDKPRGTYLGRETYGGIELDIHYLLKFSVGILKQLTGDRGSNWSATAGVGIGFL